MSGSSWFVTRWLHAECDKNLPIWFAWRSVKSKAETHGRYERLILGCFMSPHKNAILRHVWTVIQLFIPCCIGLQKPHPSPWSRPQKPQRQQLDIQNGSMWSVDVYGVYSTHHLEAKAVTRCYCGTYKYAQLWHVHVAIKELLVEFVNFLMETQ